jgi:predicted aspartyl protease
MRAISGAIAVLLCLCSGTGPPQPSPREIPFEFATRQPILPVKVNGGPAVPFVVDTGASIHVIDRELARQVKIAGGRASRMSGGGQASVDVQFVDGLTLEAAGMSWTEQRAAVAPLGYPDKKHFAGLIGAPILMRYTVEFNFPARTLRLLDPASYTPPQGAVIVPFELQADLPIVRATIDAGSGPIEARLMVDTGASTFLDLNRPLVEAHRLVDALANATPGDRPAAIGGTAPFLYGTAQRVTFGGHTFERPRLGLSRATTGSSSRSERDGVIGNELLRRWVMTVDYARRRIALTQP